MDAVVKVKMTKPSVAKGTPQASNIYHSTDGERWKSIVQDGDDINLNFIEHDQKILMIGLKIQ